jgi:Malectin domain
VLSSCRSCTPFPSQFFLIIISSLIVFSIVQGQTFLPIRINCGSRRFLDSSTNQIWFNETAYNEGNKGIARSRCSSSLSIQNVPSVELRDLYCSHRYFRNGVDVPPFRYQIPVPNTKNNSNYYTVRLHFSEIVRLHVGVSLLMGFVSSNHSSLRVVHLRRSTIGRVNGL